MVPWQPLIDLIEPFYPKKGSKGGRPPFPLDTMLRIHLMQHGYLLSDPAMEDALIEMPTMRRFAGIDLISERIPDETTILSFRHLLEKNVHDLTPAPDLLHGEETLVYADAGYQGIEKRQDMGGKQIEFHVTMRPGKRRVQPETSEGRHWHRSGLPQRR